MEISEANKCLIATPVLHLPRVAEYIKNFSQSFIVNENPSYDQLKSILNERSDISSIFVNPNSQGFILDENLLSTSRSLKCINTCSTGLNHIDLDACNELGLKLYSLTTDYELINNLPSTSELAFGMMIGLFRNLPQCAEYVLKDNWNYKDVMGHQIGGSTIGILGYGRLGKIFCNQLMGFGVNIMICENQDSVDIPKDCQAVNIQTLFRKSNAIAIHIHSTKSNKGLVGNDLLKLSKKDMILINTSRGDIVNERDIANRIVSGELGGYATDVLATEFGDLNKSPILELYKKRKHNIIITPHVGGMTYEGQEKAYLYALRKFKISI